MQNKKYYIRENGDIFMSVGDFPDLEQTTEEAFNSYNKKIEDKNRENQERVLYSNRVVELIRERYSLDDELALSRQRDTKTQEFEEYFAFCEYCKEVAKNGNGYLTETDCEPIEVEKEIEETNLDNILE